MTKKSSFFASLPHIFYLIFFLALSFFVYSNALLNDFAVVDDLAGYINNEQIRSISKSLFSFNLQQFIYSLNYSFSQMNPLPLRLFFVTNHAFVAFVLYTIIKKIYSPKIALIASLLFIAHPVNSEVVNWISGGFYSVIALFLLLALYSHLKYHENQDNRYIYYTSGIIALAFLFIRHPWIFIIPLAVVCFDLFILKNKINYSFYKLYGLLMTIIITIFFFLSFTSTFNARLEGRSAESGRIVVNQQELTPILESYPYSVYTMLKLYIFPQDLTIYYDGNPLSSTEYGFMYVVFIIYIAAIIYFAKRDKRIFGILIMLLILIAPVFSPKKITWYMTERYLYFGSGFFTLLVALGITAMEKKLSWKYFSLILTLLFLILYGYRTYNRNKDWKNPETLALSTIKTSPLSVRPYNDLGGYYAMKGRYEEAKKYYYKALTISDSLTAMRNLGYITIETSLHKPTYSTQSSYDELWENGKQALLKQDHTLAMYYFNQAYFKNPEDHKLLNEIAYIYIEAEKYDKARELLDISLNIKPNEADTYYRMGYLAFKEGNPSQAIRYLEKVLELNPDHQEARMNLEVLKGKQH